MQLLDDALGKFVCYGRTSEKLWLQVHGIEGIDGLVIVGFDLTCNALQSAHIRTSTGSHDGGVCAALVLKIAIAYPLGSPRVLYQWKP